MVISVEGEVEVIMPRLDPAMEEGRIVEWLKKEGERVIKGEVIARIETEKMVTELEAPESGVLVRILAKEGDVVHVGSRIAVIAKEG